MLLKVLIKNYIKTVNSIKALKNSVTFHQTFRATTLTYKTIHSDMKQARSHALLPFHTKVLQNLFNGRQDQWA